LSSLVLARLLLLEKSMKLEDLLDFAANMNGKKIEFINRSHFIIIGKKEATGWFWFYGKHQLTTDEVSGLLKTVKKITVC